MNPKDAYQQKLQAQLDEWNAKIKQLEARMSQANADAKIQYQEQLEELKAKQAAARDKLDELSAASEDAWQDMKQGFEDSWSRLSDAIQSAYNRFR